MSCKLEPAIWSRGTGQRISCFDRCQLIIAGMSNIKEVHGKLRLYVSFLEYGRYVGQLRRRCRRGRAYASTSNTTGQDNHEKINSWVSFIFPLHDEYGAPLGGPLGRWSSAINSVDKKQIISFYSPPPHSTAPQFLLKTTPPPDRIYATFSLSLLPNLYCYSRVIPAVLHC